MTVLKQVLAAVFAAGMIAAIAGDVVAGAKDEALVKQRQGLMGQMGKAFGPVIPILKGENPNLADAIPSTITWQTKAKQILASFPAGTDRDSVAGSRAKPEIWTDWATFEAAANKLAEESGKLVEAAKSNDIAAFRAQFKPFVKSCNGCHKGPTKQGGRFRFPKE